MGKCTQNVEISKSISTNKFKKTILRMMKKAFRSIPDDRRKTKGNFKYQLSDMIVLMVIAHLRSCHTMKAIRDFAQGEILFVKEQCGLFKDIDGVPSMSSLYRLSKYIDKNKLKDVFYRRIQRFISLVEKNERIEMNVDGKFMRGTSCGKKGDPINILTSFCNNVLLPAAVIPCPDKKSEIVAWKDLLYIVPIKGRIFTSDAMGCQTKIVDMIHKKGGFYVFALKNNQKLTVAGVEETVIRTKCCDYYVEPATIGHGRIEYRECFVYDNLTWIDKADDWAGLKRVIKVVSHVTIKKTGEQKEDDVRYYITNLEENAKEFNRLTRGHWAVESFHWLVDTLFCQDKIKRSNDPESVASENLDTIQKIAYSILSLHLLCVNSNSTKKRVGFNDVMSAICHSNPKCLEILNLSQDDILKAKGISVDSDQVSEPA